MPQLRARQGFTAEQIEMAWARQNGNCPCCKRSLAHVGCGWDAHHRDGDRGHNRTSNLLLPCVDCHHRCYHDERGVSRQPGVCRLGLNKSATVRTATGRMCNCSGCGACTSRYKVCTREIRIARARICRACATY